MRIRKITFPFWPPAARFTASLLSFFLLAPSAARLTALFFLFFSRALRQICNLILILHGLPHGPHVAVRLYNNAGLDRTIHISNHSPLAPLLAMLGLLSRDHGGNFEDPSPPESGGHVGDFKVSTPLQGQDATVET